MEPIPATLEAITELTRSGDDEIAITLARMGREVHALVPECVGLSLTVLKDDLTFTLTSTDRVVSALDAMQYLDDGPCETCATVGRTTTYSSESPTDERRWHLFAQAAAGAGISSTLSLPIVADGVVAVVNLYASTPDAFDGHHDQLAAACGAWAPGAVTNADLPFRTGAQAHEAPARIRDTTAFDVAVGMVAEMFGVDVESAATRIRRASGRAGIPVTQLVRALVQLGGTAPP